jgi:hypothetical protein
MYTLYVAVLIGNQIQEQQWKTFPRFEECWEVAQTITHNRPSITARCVRVKDSDEQRNSVN